MKSFGFPVQNKYDNPYKADTSSKKIELIQILRKSEQLWSTQGKQQQSILKLRRAISLLKYIIQNETIAIVKQSYIAKQKQLTNRLHNREEATETSSDLTYIPKGNSKGNPVSIKELNQLKGQLNDAIISEKPNVHWDDVSGLQNAKNALKEAVIMPLRFPHIFKGGRKPWTGILLYGPPGTGKTFLAKACATQAESTFFCVSSSDLLSKYVGQSEKLIKQLFVLARQRKPSVIFIDEIDSMCGNRLDNQNQASRRVKSEFLVQMQGMGHDEQGVLILGATNLPWALDPAIRRRFQRRIYIPLPQYEARLDMLKHQMKDNEHILTEDDFKQIAKKTQMFSGSDISVLVRDAIYEPVRRLQNATQFKKIGQLYIPCTNDQLGTIKGTWVTLPTDKIGIQETSRKDFEYALTRTKPSVDSKQLAEYQEFTKSFGQQG